VKNSINIAEIKNGKVKKRQKLQLGLGQDYIVIKAYNNRAEIKEETQKLIDEYYEEEDR